MVANGSLTEIAKYPAQHNHKEEIEEVKKEKMRQKFISAVKRDPTKLLKEVTENVLESTLSIFVLNIFRWHQLYIAKKVEKCRRCQLLLVPL